MTAIFTTRSSRLLSFNVKINNCLILVRFAPPVHFGVVGESTFTTRNPELIEALKSHERFGSLFFLKEEIKPQESKPEQKKELSLEDYLTDPVNVIFEESVTSKAKAVAYIQGMYDEAFSNTTSIEEMKKEAAKRWNIIFVNWK